MTFNQINYFLAFADTLNFTHAAAGLFITQSTLSRSIASLESELGVMLLDKSNAHDIRLTTAGELFSSEMREIMDKANDIITRVREKDEKEKKCLKVGVLEGLEIDRCILFAIKDMADSYPEFSVEIKKANFSDMYSKLESKELDIMLTAVSQEDLLPESCDALFLKSLPRYLVAKKEDEIWDHPINLQAVAGKSVIVPAEYFPGRTDLLHRLNEMGIQINVLEASDTETQRVILEAGVGVAISNSSSVFVSRTGRQLLKTAPLTELPDMALELRWNKENETTLMNYFVKLVSIANGEVNKNP